jgi:Ankyrin repeat.
MIDEQGLRMTPLAWHTHAGNVSIVKLLLKNGADVNADFDSQYDPEQKVTAMDLARSLMGNKAAATSLTEGNAVDDKFVKTFLALKQFGGFAYDEILAQNGDGINAEL